MDGVIRTRLFRFSRGGATYDFPKKEQVLPGRPDLTMTVENSPSHQQSATRSPNGFRVIEADFRGVSGFGSYRKKDHQATSGDGVPHHQ